jgi:hypothetical protein
MLSPRGTRGVEKAELNDNVDFRPQPRRLLNGHMYYIGLDIHKKSLSFCVKDAGGQIYQQGKVAATRPHLDVWMQSLSSTRAQEKNIGEVPGNAVNISSRSPGI